MKKEKNRIRIMILLLLIVSMFFLILLFVSSSNNKVLKTKNLCQEMISNIEMKKDIVLFVTAHDISSNEKYTIDKIMKKYNEDNLFFETSYKDLSKDCFNKMMISDDLYNEILAMNDSVLLVYKEGEYAGIIQGIEDYYVVEEFLIEFKVIERVEIKENITFNDYNDKINGEYLLLTITEEEAREKYFDLLDKAFPNIEKDVVNIKGNVGKKIKKDIIKKYKYDNIYPRIFYFKNGKVVKSDVVFDEDSLMYFKSQLNK